MFERTQHVHAVLAAVIGGWRFVNVEAIQLADCLRM
jgi:hypothetical protein